MDRHLLSFVKGLRRNGIQASLTETLDAFGALGHIPLEDREVFRETLRTTLVKDKAQHPEFLRLSSHHLNDRNDNKAQSRLRVFLKVVCSY